MKLYNIYKHIKYKKNVIKYLYIFENIIFVFCIFVIYILGLFVPPSPASMSKFPSGGKQI